MFAKLHYMDYASLIFCMHSEESDNEYSLLASVSFRLLNGMISP